jgi:ornithine decarboxylase
VRAFPGRVLYAVKANAEPAIVSLIGRGGVRHFDCASLPEIETVRAACPGARCYFMTPVRLPGAARDAREKFGVRQFLIDHESGIEALAVEVDMASSVVFVRMAVSHHSAMQNLSIRFGAEPDQVPALLQAVADTGAEPALAFNVGSAVMSPDAYAFAMSLVEDPLSGLPRKIRLLDIAGGFPKSYPGFDVPPLCEYFDVLREAIARLALADNTEILCEPARALAALGLSAVVEVLLRKENRLFLNDGMYGIFWELRFKGHDRFAVPVYRNGEPLAGESGMFSLFGPTCDSADSLPGKVTLPVDIRAGDHLEFGCIGAYSLTGRTDFNGHYSDDIVQISNGSPPK